MEYIIISIGLKSVSNFTWGKGVKYNRSQNREKDEVTDMVD